MLNANSPDALESLVLSIIRGEQDYSKILQFLEPAIKDLSGLDSDVALKMVLLVDAVEQHAELNDHIYSLNTDQGPPALVLSLEGQVLGINTTARSVFGEVIDSNFSRLGIRESDFEEFKDRIFRHKGSSLINVYPNRLKNNPLVFKGTYTTSQQIFTLKGIQSGWSDSANEAFKAVFKLSDAECDILSSLIRGMKTSEIARYRQSQIGTVRQQVKSLLYKLGVSSQVQAASLTSSLLSQADTDPDGSLSTPVIGSVARASMPVPTSVGINPPDPIGSSLQEPVIRQDRCIHWRRYGKKGGHRILLMHSAYFGPGDSATEQAWAIQAGLDVVVVERPGYGKTQPPDGHHSISDTQVHDYLAVLEHLGWSQVWLISQDYGLTSAIALANYKPDCVLGLLAVSPLPNYGKDTSLSNIPHQQRAFIWAAQHAFWMIRLLLRMGHVKARELGPEKWMDMVFEGSPNDVKVFESETGRRLASESFHFNLLQNSKGHELDMQVGIAMDWSALLENVDVPIIALAGTNNQTFDISVVKHLKTHNPKLELREVETASLTLAITHADEWHSTLLDMLASGQPSRNN